MTLREALATIETMLKTPVIMDLVSLQEKEAFDTLLNCARAKLKKNDAQGASRKSAHRK